MSCVRACERVLRFKQTTLNAINEVIQAKFLMENFAHTHTQLVTLHAQRKLKYTHLSSLSYSRLCAICVHNVRGIVACGPAIVSHISHSISSGSTATCVRSNSTSQSRRAASQSTAVEKQRKKEKWTSRECDKLSRWSAIVVGAFALWIIVATIYFINEFRFFSPEIHSSDNNNNGSRKAFASKSTDKRATTLHGKWNQTKEIKNEFAETKRYFSIVCASLGAHFASAQLKREHYPSFRLSRGATLSLQASAYVFSRKLRTMVARRTWRLQHHMHASFDFHRIIPSWATDSALPFTVLFNRPPFISVAYVARMRACEWLCSKRQMDWICVTKRYSE